MGACTFFGHKNTPNNVEPLLIEAILDLIKNKNVTQFYVGNQGSFDYYVRKTLFKLKETYPQINYEVVLAYFPRKSPFVDQKSYPTIFPSAVEAVHPKFAITKRNMWMIDNADFVITYVKNDYGGAAKFKKIAEKKGLTIIQL